MKTLNAKIPMELVQQLSDNGQLNPQYMTEFICDNLLLSVPAEKVDGLTFNYAFKVDDRLHTKVKLKAIRSGLTMNELIGRLLATYY